ncbi:ribosome silencing factor [Schnuerera sp. xch1]|uniref:ribosome silencing factor n=1 Tax=Schnuerera sp. xch1 TaxID=2874283 RepID=UPI001CBD7898|nr:ribosome silencing factor [Schnuerera sp. xch1]MBZ2175361.1 ribosome silencing factor [Schnuerera sp. xch1]
MKDIDERISVIVKACDDKNGFDIKVLDLKKLTTFTDYFIIVSGNSTTQTKAISDKIEERMNELGYVISSKEGYGEGRWILLDYGNVVVHIFHRDEREFYNLEKLWTDSEELILDEM